jgi:hypothetical protein
MSLLIATFRTKKIAGTKFGDQRREKTFAPVCAQLLIQLSSRLRFFVSREITAPDEHGKSGHHAVRKTLAGSAKRDFCMGFFRDFHSMLHGIVQPVPQFGNFACSLYLAFHNVVGLRDSLPPHGQFGGN